MGTTDRGFYLPSNAETGWGEEINANFSRTADLGVNVKAYGAVGDGVADDTAAIQGAIDAAEANQAAIFFPAGIYRVTSGLDFAATSGQVVFGSGAGGVTTPKGSIIKAGAAMDYVVSVGSTFSHFRDIRVDGNDLADNGWLIWDAARTHFDTIGGNNCLGVGVRIEDNATAFGLGNGNNNSALFTKCTAINNTSHGFFMEESNDNNIIEFIHATATGNGGDGIVVKASGAVLLGGHFEGNTGYGIRVAEASDAGATIGAKIFFPWLEANGVGGIVFTDNKASSCEYWELASGMQDVDFANSWERNTIYTNAGDNALRWQFRGDGTAVGFSYTQITVNDGSAVDTNRDLTLTSKGTGRIITSGGARVAGDAELDGALNHDGSTVGLYGVAPVTRAAALTAADASTVDGTYGAEEAAVINNLRTRLAELALACKNMGVTS